MNSRPFVSKCSTNVQCSDQRTIDCIYVMHKHRDVCIWERGSAWVYVSLTNFAKHIHSVACVHPFTTHIHSSWSSFSYTHIPMLMHHMNTIYSTVDFSLFFKYGNNVYESLFVLSLFLLSLSSSHTHTRYVKNECYTSNIDEFDCIVSYKNKWN